MTRLTKNDMARVIVAALYNMKALPAADNHEVVRWSRMRAEELRDHHKRALAAIESVADLRAAHPQCWPCSSGFR